LTMVAVAAAHDLPSRGLSVVVTRECEDARPWVQALEAEGWRVLAVPLLSLSELPSQELHLRAEEWCAAQALMFVSARAARVLARVELGLGDALRRAWARGDGPRVWAPGPGTAAALCAQGVPPERIDTPASNAAQFDSAHLWATVGDQVQPGARVILVRGEGGEQAGAGREELRQRVEAAGGRVTQAVVYRRAAPQWSDAQRQTCAKALADPLAVWLISSSLALRQGQALIAQDFMEQMAWPHGARVLVTHPRMAQTAREIGCTQVQACRPTLASVNAALQALSEAV
jgi:uroporphyrinogen-III synthase